MFICDVSQKQALRLGKVIQRNIVHKEHVLFAIFVSLRSIANKQLQLTKEVNICFWVHLNLNAVLVEAMCPLNSHTLTFFHLQKKV